MPEGNTEATWENVNLSGDEGKAGTAAATSTEGTAPAGQKAEGETVGDAKPADTEAGPDLNNLLKEETASAQATLESLGVTPENAQALLDKAKSFDLNMELIRSDPKLWLDELHKALPSEFNKLLDAASDRYLEQNKGALAGKEGDGKGTSETEELKSRLEKLERERQDEAKKASDRARQEQTVQVQSRLDKKLDETLDKVKDHLPTYERKGVRAQVLEAIGKDPTAIAQIVQGNMTAVVKHTQTVLQSHFDERKAARAAEKTARENVAEKAQTNTAAAAQASAGEQKGEPDWEAAAKGVAAALQKARK